MNQTTYGPLFSRAITYFFRIYEPFGKLLKIHGKKNKNFEEKKSVNLTKHFTTYFYLLSSYFQLQYQPFQKRCFENILTIQSLTIYILSINCYLTGFRRIIKFRGKSLKPVSGGLLNSGGNP